MSKRIDFLSLGYFARRPGGQKTLAAKNNAAFHLNKYYAEKKVISPLEAKELYAACRGTLFPLVEAAGLDPAWINLVLIEGEEPNAAVLVESGDLIIFFPLLKKKDLTRGELAAVLAHELGHVLTHNPQVKAPKRFKNPLFKDFTLGSTGAQRQMNELTADELALALMDHAGYSVEEALSINLWLAKQEGVSVNFKKETGKILDPLSTHPDFEQRVKLCQENIDNPKFKWRNRSVARLPLLGKEEQKLIGRPGLREKIETFDHLWHKKRFSLIPDVKILDELAKEVIWQKETAVYEMYVFLDAPRLLDKKLKNFMLEVKKRAEEGDMIFNFWLKALVAVIYLDGGAAGIEKRAAWLEKECGFENNEILLAVLSFTKSMRAAWGDSKMSLLRSGIDLSLEEILCGFPPSHLRDQLIGSLFRMQESFKDYYDYIEENIMEDRPSLLPEDALFDHEILCKANFEKTLSFLRGTSLLDMKETLNVFLPNSEDYRNPEDYDYRDLRDEIMRAGSDLLSSDLVQYFAFTLYLNGPYAEAELESRLAEEISLRNLFQALPYSKDISQAYLDFESYCKNERQKKFNRTFFVRYLEAVPPRQWDNDTAAVIENLPPSSEKNFLLVLLDEAGIRKADLKELVFEEIPRPDEVDLPDANLTFLNSFGFLDPGKEETIYPCGQKALDRFMEKRLPEIGPLDLKAITGLVPRPSPVRDELLDRCQVETIEVEKAKALLDAYWSPAAAYAKAYQITRAWLEGRDGKEEKTLTAVSELTAEFPSLRKRMVGEWVDRFGILEKNYGKVIELSSGSDLTDFYKGGVVMAGRGQGILGKITLGLATFAASLSREGYSLLSLHELDSAKKEALREKIEDAEGEMEMEVDKKAADEYGKFEFVPKLRDEGRGAGRDKQCRDRACPCPSK